MPYLIVSGISQIYGRLPFKYVMHKSKRPWLSMYINFTQSAILKTFYAKYHIEYTQIQTYGALQSELTSNIFMIENDHISLLPGQSSTSTNEK